jgi:nicotinate-nucleotide pyrophosphorylase (carboxylating)
MKPLALAHTNPPLALLVEPVVRGALEEDLGRAGDVTTDFTVPAENRARAVIAARGAGAVAGLIAAECAFRLLDPEVCLTAQAPDGSAVQKGDVIAELEGPARALLTGERTALNFLGHLCGVASATQALVQRVAGTKARITCTRKTTPGLRLLEKYAVRCGGGFNHRFGLDDAVLIKDNHIAAAGGLDAAVKAARARLGHMTAIELEVDTMEQLEQALSLGVPTILLDNMPPDTLKRAVEMTRGRAVLEASGGVTVERVRAIAESGVDYISSGAITHSAGSLDVGLDFL